MIQTRSEYLGTEQSVVAGHLDQRGNAPLGRKYYQLQNYKVRGAGLGTGTGHYRDGGVLHGHVT